MDRCFSNLASLNQCCQVVCIFTLYPFAVPGSPQINNLASSSPERTSLLDAFSQRRLAINFRDSAIHSERAEAEPRVLYCKRSGPGRHQSSALPRSSFLPRNTQIRTINQSGRSCHWLGSQNRARVRICTAFLHVFRGKLDPARGREVLQRFFWAVMAGTWRH